MHIPQFSDDCVPGTLCSKSHEYVLSRANKNDNKSERDDDHEERAMVLVVAAAALHHRGVIGISTSTGRRRRRWAGAGRRIDDVDDLPPL